MALFPAILKRQASLCLSFFLSLSFSPFLSSLSHSFYLKTPHLEELIHESTLL